MLTIHNDDSFQAQTVKLIWMNVRATLVKTERPVRRLVQL